MRLESRAGLEVWRGVLSGGYWRAVVLGGVGVGLCGGACGVGVVGASQVGVPSIRAGMVVGGLH